MTKSNEFKELQKRHDSAVEGLIKQTDMVNMLQQRLTGALAQQNALGQQVANQQATLQVVVDDYNHRDQSKNKEVARLRKMLKAHGIAIPDPKRE